MTEPVAEIVFSGDVVVRAHRRGTSLARDHLEALIERSLGNRYRFGEGWRGFGVVSMSLYEEPSPHAGGRDESAVAEPSPQ